jgi:hypothetical protein
MSTHKKTKYEFDATFLGAYGLDNASSMNGCFSPDRTGFFRSFLFDNNNKKYDVIGHLNREGSSSHLLFAVPLKELNQYHILSLFKQNDTYAQSPKDPTRFVGEFTGGWYVSDDDIDKRLLQDYGKLKEYAASSGPMLGCVALKLKISGTIDKKLLGE